MYIFPSAGIAFLLTIVTVKVLGLLPTISELEDRV